MTITKNFLLSFLLLFLLLVTTVSTTHIFKDPTKPQQLQLFSHITTLPGLSISASYLEPRIRAYDDHTTELSPTLKKIHYMDFTYAK